MAQPTSQPLSLDMVMNKVIEELERGQQSMQLITALIDQQLSVKVEDHNHDYLKGLDDHAKVAYTTFVNSLSLLKQCTNDSVASADHCIEETPKNNPTIKDRRGCYKRRRMGDTKEMEVTQLTDDGFAWRKYGQKVILNRKHPRNYFRCTHKYDQNCQAIKQVQQVSDNPLKYRIVYQGNHTCNHTLRSCPIIIDSPAEHSAAIFLNFESNSTTKKHFDQFFPTSAYPNADTVLKQEQYAFTEEGTSVSHDSYDVYPSTSSQNQSSSQCLTAVTGVSSTPVFDQNDNSTASSYVMDEDYSSMWAEYPEISKIFMLM